MLKNYQEVALPELKSLLSQILVPNQSWADDVVTGVLNAPSGIPDYQDQLQSLPSCRPCHGMTP